MAREVRDSIAGNVIRIGREGHHVVINDDNVGVIYLNPSAALFLARQLIDAVTAEESINVLGGDD